MLYEVITGRGGGCAGRPAAGAVRDSLFLSGSEAGVVRARTALRGERDDRPHGGRRRRYRRGAADQLLRKGGSYNFV